VNPTDRFPRASLGEFPTPLRRLQRLERILGGGQLVVKRDDMAGFAVAGNKTRPLEFLIGGALAQGCELVVGGGAPKSNFAAALAVAARSFGLGCELLVPGDDVADPPAAFALAKAAGAAITFTGGDRADLDRLIDARALELSASGRPAYAVPRGGACAVGALGFACAATELAGQGIDDEATIVLPAGSGASIAGLLAGAAAVGAGWRVVGVSVSRPLAEMTEHVSNLATACSDLMGTPRPSSARIVDATEPGMDAVTEAERSLVAQAYQSEGLLFDPSYGAKSLRHVAELIRTGATQQVVLWHTGGISSAIPLVAQGVPA
jgi:1-aminocyclopropane-1-carboxylate deaminase/D-cysteine desulfhydrase-like pyridoxal-dependent ACC family enzyme